MREVPFPDRTTPRDGEFGDDYEREPVVLDLRNDDLQGSGTSPPPDPSPIVVISAACPPWFASRTGGRAWLLPEQADDPGMLVLANRAARMGFCLIPGGLSVADVQEPGRTGTAETPPSLTDRESEIIQLLSEGWSNSDMARLTGLSLGTVKFHITRVFEKLHAVNRAEAVRRAAEFSLLRF